MRSQSITPTAKIPTKTQETNPQEKGSPQKKETPKQTQVRPPKPSNWLDSIRPEILGKENRTLTSPDTPKPTHHTPKTLRPTPTKKNTRQDPRKPAHQRPEKKGTTRKKGPYEHSALATPKTTRTTHSPA